MEDRIEDCRKTIEGCFDSAGVGPEPTRSRRTSPGKRKKKNREDTMTKTCWKYNLDTLSIEDRKTLKRFENKFLEEMPEELQDIWEDLTFREKLFVPYTFQVKTNTEAAILAGFAERNAVIRGSQTYRKVEKIIKWFENVIIDQITKRAVITSVLSKEAVLEKLALMFTPDLGDMEDYEEAKANGFLAAAKEVEFIPVYDEDGIQTGYKRVVTKVIDQRAVGMAICDILGYKASEKREISGPGGVPLQTMPVINVFMNSIKSPLKNGDDAIPIQVKNIKKNTLI